MRTHYSTPHPYPPLHLSPRHPRCIHVCAHTQGMLSFAIQPMGYGCVLGYTHTQSATAPTPATPATYPHGGEVKAVAAWPGLSKFLAAMASITATPLAQYVQPNAVPVAWRGMVGGVVMRRVGVSRPGHPSAPALPPSSHPSHHNHPAPLRHCVSCRGAGAVPADSTPP